MTGLAPPPPQVTPRQAPPLAPESAPLPQTRLLYPLVNTITPLGRRIPGLAKYSTCCGIQNGGNKIVGGTATSANQYPWMVRKRYALIS